MIWFSYAVAKNFPTLTNLKSPFDMKPLIKVDIDLNLGKGFQVITETCELPFDFQCNLKSLELEEKPSNKIVFSAISDLPAVLLYLSSFPKYFISSLLV